ncbi:hypothetical protein [Streptomyces sp. CRN 30]|uniref:hypothetical protein n=1 Tax=Streptomyces sp. CRN 30 TaxID=3075613 RepID=UPI002A81DBCF|nr:hypothetical protein [Streptomyces sp. CRN 30]
MSQEAGATAGAAAVPQQTGTAQPRGLLQQMEELMAALNADLTQLGADLSTSSATRPAPADTLPRMPAGTSADILANGNGTGTGTD